MGTRAAAFTAKIHNLQDYCTRIQHGILPLPSGVDVANTLKYFSQTLLSVLKDVHSIPMEVIRSPEKDHARTSLFPSLDYKSLYNAIVQLVDCVPLVQYGAHALGHTILHTMGCLVPFLEHEYMDTLPYIVASSVALFPSSLHKDVVEMLCNHLLPFTIIEDPGQENQNYANMSISAVIMMVFQYTECNAYHCQLLECLMSLKRNVVKDLLCVIAHGSAKARCHAVELLFQYMPTLNPSLHDRKGFINRLNGWKAMVCQRESCLSPVNNEAVKICFDHSIGIGSGEQLPPLYVCQGCAEEISREHGPEHLVDILLPMVQVSLTCENKDCKSSDKSAVSTCFAIECAANNSHRPIRYCVQCSSFYHNNERGGSHIFHSSNLQPWAMDPETQSYMVEAIVSLLSEAQPLGEKHCSESSDQGGFQEGEDSRELSTVEERQLLSRYGIWLLIGLCTPNEDTPVETLGRLLSMLFQWFHYTACLPDDQAGNALERLKSEYIHGWLMDVVKSHFEVFVSCLLPHPSDYAQVGGHWDTWPSRTNHIKEGFKRLLCLVPYDIITSEVWEYIMPFWMEAFRHEIPEEELSELKILLSKVLDPDLSPLGFDTKQMYRFVSIRFDNTSAPVQEQALYWLQILTLLEVPVPLDLLFAMFNNGVEATSSKEQISEEETGVPCKVIPHPEDQQPTTGVRFRQMWPPEGTSDNYGCPSEPEYKSDAEINLACYILMLDILVKQLELQEVSAHKGLDHPDAQRVMILLKQIVKAPWVGQHTCSEGGESSLCLFCEMSAIWFQLALVLAEYFCPVMEVTMADIPTDTPHNQPLYDNLGRTKGKADNVRSLQHQHSLTAGQQPKGSLREISLSLVELQQIKLPQSIVEGDENGVPYSDPLTPIQTATVQECTAELDTVAIMPTEKVVTAFARAVTLTEDDVAVAKCTVASAVLVDENDQAVSQTREDTNFWPTSQGRFKFTIEELPVQLQLLYSLLKELAVHKDADVLYHILSCLKVMCLHAEVLNKAAHSHRGFLIWCQENLLVSNLWKLLQTEFSHISQLATSLLLHCITLPCGADMFWKVVEEDFHNNNWRSRYAAVEKVTMIAHFIDSATVKNSPLLQSSLANAFCYLVHCMDDNQPTVSQRALLNLETIKTPSLKLLLWCLEVQFDSVIVDRPMILQTIFQLFNQLNTRRFLTWDFFLNRFDALFLEAQINLEKAGEISYTRDLRNSNTNSEMFQRKLNRAHEALTLLHASRSLTASFGTKWPYKRAMSAPGGMISKQEKWVDKEKIYSRQSSAPVLKRKSSKLTGGPMGGPLQHFPNSFFPDGHIKEMAQEESHLLHVLHRVMDMEDYDKDTIHLLIFLLMQFLSRPDLSHPSEEKVLARNQMIVLRHINILLGYSPTEKGFLIPPYKLRVSPVFCSFLLALPKVLDYNFSMGNIILSTCLPLLIYCPSPQRYPHEHHTPNYSLWLLSPPARHSWLQSTLVFLYKYHYNSHPLSKQVHMLISIVLNTLEAQHHHCKQTHDTFLSPVPSRSRDLSTASVDLENVQEKEYLHTEMILDEGGRMKSSNPKPYSRAAEVEEQLQKSFKDRQQWKSWKMAEFSCSSDGEDAEPELEAIPESPKSETSDQEKVLPGSLELPTADLAAQARVRVVSDVLPGDAKVTVTSPFITISSVVVDGTKKSPHVFTLAEPPKSKRLTKDVARDNKEPANAASSDDVTEKKDYTADGQPFDTNRKKCIAPPSSLQGDEFHIDKSLHEAMEKHTAPEKIGSSSQVSEQQKQDDIAEHDSQVQTDVSQGVVSESSAVDLFSSSDMSTVQTGAVSTNYPTAVSESDSSHQVTVKTSFVHQDSIQLAHKKEASSLVKSEGNRHQKVLSRSPSDVLNVPSKSNIVKQNSFEVADCESSTQQTAEDSLHKALKPDFRFSTSFEPLISKPTPERLLPVGLFEKDAKAKKPESYLHKQLMPKYSDPEQPKSHEAARSKETQYFTGHKLQDLSEDKGVQIGGRGSDIEIPAPERLLPVGPVPSRKEGDCVSVPGTNIKRTDYLEGPFGPLPVKVKKQQKAVKMESRLHPQEESSVQDADDPESVSGKDAPEVTLTVPVPSDQTPSSVSEGQDEEPTKGSSREERGSLLPGSGFEEVKSSDQPEKDVQPGSHTQQDGDRELPAKSESLDSRVEEEICHPQGEKGPPEDEVKGRLHYRQKKQRKTGLSTLDMQRLLDLQNGTSKRSRKSEMGSSPSVGMLSKRSSTSHSSSARYVEDLVVERCGECGAIIEEYNDDELGLCIVILATFVHREPGMAAPLLPEMLQTVARIAATASYPWQCESNIHLPGSAVSIARQFLRCTFHQLAPNGIFIQIFQSHFSDSEFFKTMAVALADFAEVNQVSPLLLLFEHLNEKKHLHHEGLLHILENVATYLDCLPLESSLPPWCLFLQQLEWFLRKYLLTLPPGPCNLMPLIRIMNSSVKTPVINSSKSILDPFSKVLSFAVQHSPLDYQQLSELCHNCYRNLSRERDKLVLTRTAVFELVQALKFKSSLPDANILMLVQFVLEDAGGTLSPSVIIEGLPTTSETQIMYNTTAGECMRQYLNDALDFIADVHTLNKIKGSLHGASSHLNEETLGGHLKAGVAQYISIEISKGNGRDNRAIGRYLPWLYHPPTSLQQGPKEFMDCVAHIRLLSWLLLGALMHSTLLNNIASFTCQPVPLEANNHIAEHIQVILAGFAEQSKVSVLHMSSLFHAFILCQLWTMYCEHMVSLNPPGSEQNQTCCLALADFWSKVTPGILQLVCHSKVLAEMVTLHFLSLMEALMECNSTVLARLLPMWTSVLYKGQLPGHLKVRLHACLNWQPPSHTREEAASITTTFLKWLQRLQFKIGQIELQSSAATQFYSL